MEEYLFADYKPFVEINERGERIIFLHKGWESGFTREQAQEIAAKILLLLDE